MTADINCSLSTKKQFLPRDQTANNPWSVSDIFIVHKLSKRPLSLREWSVKTLVQETHFCQFRDFSFSYKFHVFNFNPLNFKHIEDRRINLYFD